MPTTPASAVKVNAATNALVVPSVADFCSANSIAQLSDLTGLLDYKGALDCSANPNYPAASKGDYYVVSVAGKIGGASGTNVTAKDSLFAKVDTAAGTEAAVGSNWDIIQGDIDLSAISITGGNIDDTVIGATTSAPGYFTQVLANDPAAPVIQAGQNGNTPTGFLIVQGATSGQLKITGADAMAQTVIVSVAAQTTGDATLTIPNVAGVSDTFVFASASQSLTNKKLGSLTSNGLVTTSGSNGTLSVTVPGTGVLTALGNATNATGGLVTFSGALGTPLSGTLGTGITINLGSITVGSALPAAGGGTGQTIYTVGDILYASGSTTLSKLSTGSTSGFFLRSQGSAFAPTWSSFALPTSTVTSGGVLYCSSTTAVASSSLLTANALMIGGGAGAAPSTTTTGTGVLTMLGQAVTGSGGPVCATSPSIATPSITGQCSFAAGSVGAPSLTTTGDLDTGIWFPAANTLAASVAGARGLNLMVGGSSARLGVNSTSGTATFHVIADSAINGKAMRLSDNTNAQHAEFYCPTNDGFNTAAAFGTATNHHFGIFTNNSGWWCIFTTDKYFKMVNAAGALGILNVDGSVSAPSYTFASDTDTGIYRSGSNVLDITTGGTAMLSASLANGVTTPKTITAAGTTGAQTINKPCGSVNFAAAATSLVVTNSMVTTSSAIQCTVGTNDATMTCAQAVAGSGSFTIYPNAAPTGETRVNFFIHN